MKRDLSLPAEIQDESTLTLLMEMVGETVIYIDDSWVVRYCNSVYEAYIGKPKSEIIGRTPPEFFPNFEKSIFYEIFDRCKRENKQFTKIGYSKGMGRWLIVRVFPCFGGGVLGTANDASEQMVRQTQMVAQMTTDQLTGLPNKVALTERMDQLLAAEISFELVIIGIQRFRRVNDAIGYSGGDLVLLELCSMLKAATDDSEELFRINGDEFAVLRSANLDDTPRRISSLLQALQAPIFASGHEFVLEPIAGAARGEPDACEAESLLTRASLALKETKTEGRAPVKWYDPELERAVQLRTLLESELRVAIEGRRMDLHLQPKGCLRTGAVVGAEALIRWNHPTLGFVSPGDFLPLAHEAGLMGQLDTMVMLKAAEHLERNLQLGLRVPVSINLSARTIADRLLPDKLFEILHLRGIDRQLLEVEIPEGALVLDINAAKENLSRLRNMGIKVSIDDFGTGYSSFGYLATLPMDTLKIDRSFVQHLGESDASMKIVRSIVNLARSLGLSVVAEGAESESQMQALRKLRCDQVQGFGYGRPMVLSAFQRFAIERIPLVPPIDPMTI
jgi:diguanylate cyclase (GGDEF)-like protein/PAS domain S-box-containing protein